MPSIKPPVTVRMSFVPVVLAGVVSFTMLLAGFLQSFPHGVSRKGAPSQTFSVIKSPTPTPPPESGVKVPILLYHYISENPNKEDKMRTWLSTSPGIFEQQLVTLQSNGFTTITFDELSTAVSGSFHLPAKPVILTFDDGYEDFYHNAFPLLEKYHMKGTAFIPTGLMGRGNYMTWNQIDELGKSAYVVLAAHSIHHYSLPTVSSKVLADEVELSKRILEQHVNYKINWFAYPYGTFNDAVIAAIKHAGYIGAITTLPGSWEYRSKIYTIPRYRAGNRLGDSFLKLLL